MYLTEIAELRERQGESCEAHPDFGRGSRAAWHISDGPRQYIVESSPRLDRRGRRKPEASTEWQVWKFGWQNAGDIAESWRKMSYPRRNLPDALLVVREDNENRKAAFSTATRAGRGMACHNKARSGKATA